MEIDNMYNKTYLKLGLQMQVFFIILSYMKMNKSYESIN